MALGFSDLIVVSHDYEHFELPFENHQALLLKSVAGLFRIQIFTAIVLLDRYISTSRLSGADSRAVPGQQR